jgi:probable F420-dependent oxidoreductase
MKVGIFVLLSSNSPDVAVLAKRAEELGFDSFWVPEHIAIPARVDSRHPRRHEDQDYADQTPHVYWQIMDPFVALGRVSAVTNRIKLGTSISLVAQYHPAHLAKLVATVDTYSRGRFTLGVGTGWLREELELFGVDFDRRWSQTAEALSAMQAIWSGPENGFKGKFYDIPPIDMDPKPVQRPRPPIYLGGSPSTIFQRLVTHADGWLAPRLSVETTKTARSTLDDLSEKAGRPRGCIDICVFGLPDHSTDPDLISAYAEAGADTVVPWLLQDDEQEALREMERIAERLLR